MQYDAEHEPDAQEWLALDESERIVLVEDYHRWIKANVPRAGRAMHANLHCIIENQLAMQIPSVTRNFSRLMGEGLSRHDAVHAVSTVMIEHIHDLLNGKAAPGDAANEAYAQALDKLTAKGWLDSFSA